MRARSDQRHAIQEARAHGVDFTNGTIPDLPYPFYLRALRAEIGTRSDCALCSKEG